MDFISLGRGSSQPIFETKWDRPESGLRFSNFTYSIKILETIWTGLFLDSHSFLLHGIFQIRNIYWFICFLPVFCTRLHGYAPIAVFFLFAFVFICWWYRIGICCLYTRLRLCPFLFVFIVVVPWFIQIYVGRYYFIFFSLNIGESYILSEGFTCN